MLLLVLDTYASMKDFLSLKITNRHYEISFCFNGTHERKEEALASQRSEGDIFVCMLD